TIALTMPSSNAAASNVTALSKWRPEKIFAASHSPIATIATRRKNGVICTLLQEQLAVHRLVSSYWKPPSRETACRSRANGLRLGPGIDAKLAILLHTLVGQDHELFGIEVIG